MLTTTAEERQRARQLSRAELGALQLQKLNRLLTEVRTHNAFYQRKLAGAPAQLESLQQLTSLPRTSKDELQPASGDERSAANRTYPLERYVRFHQTSGTRGRPLTVLDTADDWQGWIDAWQYVLDAADLTAGDRALLAFSFGPFIGFWSAFDALVERGALAIPGGGMSSLARIELIRSAEATALFCTPTYALRLAEVAAEHSIDLRRLPIEKIVVAGEPGGSIPATRQRIEAAWDARLIDHAGATEVGPWGFADSGALGLHINEVNFLPEFISVATGEPAEEGELSHLLLTTLDRLGAPVIRYRTGDLVRPRWNAAPSRGDDACGFVVLEGGILGRSDDMLIVRGVNVFPTALEQILRSFPEVVEYRITARRRGELDELVVEVEDHLQQPTRIAEEFKLKLGLKIDVRCVTAMSLPRFEGKGGRFVDQRTRAD